jgi:NAD(P)H-dependent FMN reductase
MSGAGAPRFTTRDVTLEMKPRILLILGSTREGRVGERVALWLLRQLDGQQAAAFELVDLRDYPLPIYERPSGERRGATVQRWADKVAAADGYVVVTPEYNHGYPAALKSALDHASDEWNRKPVAFVSYGGHAAGYRVRKPRRGVGEPIRASRRWHWSGQPPIRTWLPLGPASP